jgi:hypothetical protein
MIAGLVFDVLVVVNWNVVLSRRGVVGFLGMVLA